MVTESSALPIENENSSSKSTESLEVSDRRYKLSNFIDLPEPLYRPRAKQDSENET